MLTLLVMSVVKLISRESDINALFVLILIFAKNVKPLQAMIIHF